MPRVASTVGAVPPFGSVDTIIPFNARGSQPRRTGPQPDCKLLPKLVSTFPCGARSSQRTKRPTRLVHLRTWYRKPGPIVGACVGSTVMVDLNRHVEGSPVKRQSAGSAIGLHGPKSVALAVPLHGFLVRQRELANMFFSLRQIVERFGRRWSERR